VKTKIILIAILVHGISSLFAQEMQYRLLESKDALNQQLVLDEAMNNPDDFNAQYHAARLYYNAAVNELSNAKTTEEGFEDSDLLTESVMLHFRKALPYAEAAYRLNKTDKNVVYMLEGIWFGLGNTGQSAEYGKKLKALNE
jgi:hypothetical protein